MTFIKAISFSLLILISITAYNADAQTELSIKSDSLKLLIKRDANDSLKAHWNNLLFNLYAQNQPDTAIFYGKKAKALAAKTGDEGLQGMNALYFGHYYWWRSDLKKAMEQYVEAAALFEKQNDAVNLATARSSIGSIYMMTEDLEKSRQYFEQVIPVYRENNSTAELSNTYNYLGILQVYTGNLDSAIYYFENSLSEAEKIGSQSLQARGVTGLAEIYKQLGQMDKAREYQARSLELDKLQGNTLGVMLSYIQMGSLEKDAGNYSKARSFYKKAEEMPVYQESILHQQGLSQEYVDLYEREGNYQKALEYLRNFHTLRDSISDSEDKAYINELNEKYETARKESQILELEKNQKINELTLQQEQTKNNLFLIGILFVIALLSFVLVIYFQARKKKRETEKRNELITNINKKLNQSQDALLAANKTRDKLFALIAHDLRGPISSFQGIGKILEYTLKKGDAESMREVVESVDESATQINLLLDNLLKWTLSQTGTLPFSPSAVNLRVIAEENVAVFEQISQAKQITVENKIEEVLVLADRNTVSTVFRNLMGNALKFTEEGGYISLNSTIKEDEVAITVTDSGIGMTDEKLKTLFNLDPAKSTTGTKGEKGTGLGTMLCYEFVTKNGGEIHAESEIGRGTEITFTLPLLDKQEEAALQNH